MKLRITLFGIFILLVLSACSNELEGDISIDVGSFSYTNQDNQPFSSTELEGKYWIANMIFTNCPSICPGMTVNMAKLQDMIKQEGLDVELVSFSVDPENDTPEKLKEYSEVRGGEFDNWNLLTGYEFQEIKEFSIKSFQATVKKIPDSDDMIHSTQFYLITPDGKAIKRYDGRKAAEMDTIVADLKKVM